MRGTLRYVLHFLTEIRIIPAYAGNTLNQKLFEKMIKDHPRVCGEHPSDIGVLHRQGGSSPRMRGTLRAYIFIKH